jgi:hypothetical protein
VLADGQEPPGQLQPFHLGDIRIVQVDGEFARFVVLRRHFRGELRQVRPRGAEHGALLVLVVGQGGPPRLEERGARCLSCAGCERPGQAVQPDFYPPVFRTGQAGHVLHASRIVRKT